MRSRGNNVPELLIKSAVANNSLIADVFCVVICTGISRSSRSVARVSLSAYALSSINSFINGDPS